MRFRNGFTGFGRSHVAVLVLFSFITSSLTATVSAERGDTKKAQLSSEQQIVHVLNRLGFGARPGDVERVKALGIENYINQQLQPEKISDEVADAKVQNLATLQMTTAQLYEKFPQPNMLIRQLERTGNLPKELAEAQKNQEATAGNAAKDAPPTTADGATPVPPNQANGNPMDNPEYRRMLREYYAQNGLQLPQRIIAELQASRIMRAVYSERQLNEVMVDFWTNHFNVFAGKGADRWLLTAYDRDTIRPNAMGKFSDLLVATAQSPAMLFYLDNFQSVSPNAQLERRNQRPLMRADGPLERMLGNARRGRLLDRDRRQDDVMMQRLPRPEDQQRPPQQQQQARRGINENYARELMELHTLGVDGGYTQKDVQEVARCFTGWTIFAPRGGAAAAASLMGNAARENAGRFFFNARMHDDGEKVVLGHKIPAGGGFKDGMMVLDILAHHPSTARFLAQKLVRHFVSDTPSPALVDRVATRFMKSDGDIRETLKAIFFSPEFNSPEAYRAKVKRPFELAISAIRTLGAETNGGPQLHQWIARMGEPLYGFQTPNGYSDAAESWVNTGGLLERLNFGLALASNRIPGTRVDLKHFVADQTDKQKMMDRFLTLITGGDVSQKTRETLLKQVDGPVVISAPAPVRETGPAQDRDMSGPPIRQRELARNDATITDPVTKIVGLILGSPEFQKQ